MKYKRPKNRRAARGKLNSYGQPRLHGEIPYRLRRKSAKEEGRRFTG